MLLDFLEPVSSVNSDRYVEIATNPKAKTAFKETVKKEILFVTRARQAKHKFENQEMCDKVRMEHRQTSTCLSLRRTEYVGSRFSRNQTVPVGWTFTNVAFMSLFIVGGSV